MKGDLRDLAARIKFRSKTIFVGEDEEVEVAKNSIRLKGHIINLILIDFFDTYFQISYSTLCSYRSKESLLPTCMEATPARWDDQPWTKGIRSNISRPLLRKVKRAGQACDFHGSWIMCICWNSTYFQLCFCDAACPLDRRPPSGSQWAYFTFPVFNISVV